MNNSNFMPGFNDKIPTSKTPKELAAQEVETMTHALDEAHARLEGAPDEEEMIDLWSHDQDDSPEKIETFLQENQTRLSPQAIFFLNTIIYLRKAKEKYRQL